MQRNLNMLDVIDNSPFNDPFWTKVGSRTHPNSTNCCSSQAGNHVFLKLGKLSIAKLSMIDQDCMKLSKASEGGPKKYSLCSSESMMLHGHRVPSHFEGEQMPSPLYKRTIPDKYTYATQEWDPLVSVPLCIDHQSQANGMPSGFQRTGLN